MDAGSAGATARNPSGKPAKVTFALPADEAAPQIARRYLAEHAAGVPAGLTDDALLLVSELVTNAVRHGQPDIFLTIRPHPPGIGVAVRDHGPELPTPSVEMPEPTAPRGRGLRIVDALSSDWGIELVDPPPGKIVWFELEQPSAP